MNKIFIVGGLPSGHGGIETVINKINKLIIPDFEVKVILFDYNQETNKDWLEKINYKIIKTSLYFRFFEKISFICQLRNIIKKEQPSLIIGFDSKGCLFSYKAIKPIKNKCKLISWCHFSFDTFPDKEKKYLLSADYHLVIANEIKQQMIEFGFNENTISTVYNPAEKKLITIPSNKNDEEIVFIYVGRIQYSSQKNIKNIFYSLSQIKYKYRLHLIGDGPDVQRLKDLSYKLNISNKVVFHGWKSDPWEYIIKNIGNVNALLLSSNYEGLPMTLIEAISYGVFCISSDCKTGPKEIITNENGLIYKKNDTNDFVDKLNYFYKLETPSSARIKNSISFLYEESYIKNFKSILNAHLTHS